MVNFKHIRFLMMILFVSSSTDMFSQGLGFHGMEVRIDQRTSYNVFGNRPEVFNGEFHMKFELYTKPTAEFGYFFRIKDCSDSRRIWNLSYDSRGDSIVVRLNEEGRHSLIKASLDHDGLKPLHWHKVALDVDLLKDSVRLEIAGQSFSAHSEGLPDRLRACLEFGRSDHIIDVPAFAIRDLRVSGAGKEYSFPLNQRTGISVPDSRHRLRGSVQNPEWLINEALRWKEIGSFSYSDIAGASYNPVRKEFLYFTRDEMTVLDLMDDRSYSFRFRSPCPVEMKLGNNFVTPDGKRVICYELSNDEAPPGSPSVAEFDLDSGDWRALGTQRLDMPLHHHGCFINPVSGRYTILGGFGNMLYNGSFYELYEKSGTWNEVWKEHGGDVIYPRYFTSTGTDDKYIYVYGGMGNECGEQVVGRRYFYDLHRVEPRTGDCTLLWRLDWEGAAKVPVRNLCVDDYHFYTLCYPEYVGKSELYLYRFSIADGSREILGDSIPIISDKMRTNANIWLDRELGCFFATVQEFEDDIKSTLKIYSLAYPPLTADEAPLDGESGGGMPWWAVALCVLAGVSALSGAAVTAARNRKRRAEELGHSYGGTGSRKIFRHTQKPDSISLFGDFTVLDHDGKDITTMFTTQQILILCLLIKRGDNGISTRRLSSILWPDKEEEKVKNSRGVALNNLRRSLSRLEGASVAYRDGRYYLELTPPCSCDWFELNSSLREKNLDKSRILGIISGGKFLKSIGDEIFDDFKERAENIVLPLLQEELDARFKAKDYEAVCEIGEMIAVIDPTDENALRTVIRVMRRQKRTEEALVVYAAFCAEYKKANDADFGIPFKEI